MILIRVLIVGKDVEIRVLERPQDRGENNELLLLRDEVVILEEDGDAFEGIDYSVFYRKGTGEWTIDEEKGVLL